ncbi:MAG: hypothetical protein JO336_04790 [Acidobacteriia bacterium]|nr:hypothetical protein [Terriglobia bacterium]MBV9268390.1 hypothetical protein [Acidobacteriaceae bacterium]
MNNGRLDLVPILDAIRIEGPTAFAFQGEALGCATAAEAEARLRDLLYERCYMRRLNTDARSPAMSNGNTSLLNELRSANHGRARWQSGWRIESVLNGNWITAGRDGLTRTFAPGEFITKEGPGMPLRVGAAVDVYFAVESEYMQPGFYFAFGETVSDEWDNGCLLRFYWHLEPAGAALLLASISSRLNRFQVPYRFKCLIAPGAYIRADSAVLFVPRRCFQVVARLLRDTRRSIASHLRTEAPLFTKSLAHGLAFAEDPGAAQSFGMHRCGVLAQSMCEVASNGKGLARAALEEALERKGVSVITPYLNPGSADIYDFVP